MDNAAMTQLEERIRVMRQEAYNAGYAAAMQAVHEFVGGSSGAAATHVRKSTATRLGRKSSPARRSLRAATKAQALSRPEQSRVRRGSNALLVAEVLKGMARATRAADIRRALQREKGVTISYPSIRHALDQLAQRGLVEPSSDRKTWHYVGAA